ncbi:MAG: hypothetical protein C3F18_03425 [Nitrosomonadales bacterium]|nr:MAG: hypothetical protein C3F18_03425 [Nitrosomonadales bacterium]
MRETVKHILLPALLALLLGAAPATRAHDHEHSHQEAAPQQLTLKNGHKWATDEALRQAMSRIRAEMAASQPAKQGERVPLQQYQAAARKVNEQIAFMVQNCKLDKDADAMLHLVLADIIAGADAMAGQNWGNARQGAKKITHALENYATYFEHPGW